MWIMIAGPYRSGANSEADREQNLANLNRAAYELFRKGSCFRRWCQLHAPADSGPRDPTRTSRS